jgi:hypothetical protein
MPTFPFTPTFHVTPTFPFTPSFSSWLNAVEGFFATLARRRLTHGVFRSVVDLQAAISSFVAERNSDGAEPFAWRADPEAIIASRGRGVQALEAIHQVYFDLPEKIALLILSRAFISSVIGGSGGMGIIFMGLGLFGACIGTCEDFHPRLSFGTQSLAQGFAVTTAVLGVLVLGEVLKSLEERWYQHRPPRPGVRADAVRRSGACAGPTSAAARPISCARR